MNAPDLTSKVMPEIRADRIRVAHVAARLTLAGLGNVVASLVRGMKSSPYDSAVWCLEEADTVGRMLRAEGHDVVEFGKKRRRDIGLFFRIAAQVRKQRIQVLHCHDELSWFYGAIGGRLGGAGKILLTVHGRRFDMSQRHVWEQKVLAYLSTAIIGVSSALCEQVVEEIGVARKKVLVIRNGIPLEHLSFEPKRRARARKILGIADDATLVGCAGRLDPDKNLDLLLEASADALRTVPSMKVVLVGEGPSEEHLLKKTAELGLQNTVTFTGLRSDVADILPAFDLYVCSSDREGVSLSILEAMASERPVIATAVGGNTEVIEDGRTGLLIERGNRSALSAAIVALALDQDKRDQLGRQARRAVEENFSIDHMVQEYDHFYRSIMA